MDWRWRGLSARPSLQRTSKASTKGAVKEAAMVKLPLLCSELVLQAMKVIFSGRQGKSADGWTSSLAQKSVGTYNWLMQIPRLSQQHSPGCSTAHRQKNTFALQNSPNLTSLTTPTPHPPFPPLSLGAVVFISCMQMLDPTACWRLWSSASCCCQHCWYHIYWLYSVGKEKHIAIYLHTAPTYVLKGVILLASTDPVYWVMSS